MQTDEWPLLRLNIAEASPGSLTPHNGTSAASISASAGTSRDPSPTIESPSPGDSPGDSPGCSPGYSPVTRSAHPIARARSTYFRAMRPEFESRHDP